MEEKNNTKQTNEQVNFFNKISQKWQKKWDENNIFKSNTDFSKKKFYVLEMYPYPSGKMHMGHVRNYSLGDSYARYKRMNGFNVLYPMGYDAFGLPAENAAIKNNIHPKNWTISSMDSMRDEQKSLGMSYDWDREIASLNPDYYKWNQWFFLELYKRGLAYKKKATINWCDGCNTVLANEQVEDGKCWRCDFEVIKKDLEQWFFKITDYADELDKDIEKLDEWPEKVKIMQKNWIGKSYGTTIKFDLVDENSKKIDTIEVFTTRPDTLFGVTGLVLAPEHKLVSKIIENNKDKEKLTFFVNEQLKKSNIQRTENKEKNGIFTNYYVKNPLNDELSPLFIADYVLLEYGTGAVMVVPAHDQRDLEFALKYDLKIKQVIIPKDKSILEKDIIKNKKAFVDFGVLVNSNEFNGLDNTVAIDKISINLEKNNFGKKTTNFKIRDWLISRQRFWGTPIPIIYCDKCGILEVPKKDLPVLLPEDVDFNCDGNPLLTSKSFNQVKCPKCGINARRETDTMDTFVDSSWYFFRFCSPKFDDGMFDKKDADYWMNVDQYIGGIEHAVLHLLYARFFTKVLRDLGLTKVDEPFKRLLTQGMVIKDGFKMSKSKGNVVSPKEIIEKYGADTARTFILFASLPEKELDWNDKGVEGIYKFLNRFYNLVIQNEFSNKDFDFEKLSFMDKYILSLTNLTIKKVTNHYEKFEQSLAIGKIMEFVNELNRYDKQNKEVFFYALKNAVLLISPVAPHLAEELYEKLGFKNFISLEKWPVVDESLIDEKSIECSELINNIIFDIRKVIELAKIKKPEKINIIISKQYKYDLFSKVKEQLSITRNTGEIIKAIMQDDKLKKYGKDISKLIVKLVNDESKLPKIVLNQEIEKNAVSENINLIKDKFEDAIINVVLEEESTEDKAKQAMPKKPAIIV
ncbi:MAG: leucine--tRNA ligase, partial [Candidatus Woesearchaeota archaeon]